ncbi:EF-hand domain-containing protein [Tabrizicola sp.]|uniref:EF-hand domain-containing protein n=1 Tax=Tabrizicola sp. TaxID=2005166 RepID=UPI00286C8605|nr:EF-hand domain-containing protein [Tabrizicola sp.]
MTARTQTAIILAALLTATMASAAFADKGPDGPSRGDVLLDKFDSIDTDKDGKVSEAELAAFRAAEFAAADTNFDGMLSAEELTQKQLARMAETAAMRSAKMIEERDDNGDGSLSADEMDQSVQESRFSRIDQDDDGAISKDEAEEALKRFADNRKKHRKGMNDAMEN